MLVSLLHEPISWYMPTENVYKHNFNKLVWRVPDNVVEKDVRLRVCMI